MTEIKFTSISILNFKGIARLHLDFSDSVKIMARNGLGKSTIFDAITWAMFNTDSRGNTSFSIRRKLPDGTDEHFTDISVEIEMEVTDENGITLKHTISKTQKEKWTKRRGSEQQEFQGNVNGYSVDGFAVKEAEFKNFIEGLIGIKVFKLLSDPLYFNELEWKERRQILMSIVNVGTYVEAAERYGSYAELLDDLRNAPDLDSIIKKYSSSKNELNKKVGEIPVRIDELNGMIADVDVDALETRKRELIHKMDKQDAAITDRRNKIDAINDAISKTSAKITDIEHEHNLNAVKAEAERNTRISTLQAEINTDSGEIRYAESQINMKRDEIVRLNETGNRMNAEYREWKYREFPENSTVCPYCGQTLPEDEIADRREKFQREKAQHLEQIMQQGKDTKSKRDALEHDLKELESRAEKYRARKADAEKTMNEVMNEKRVTATPINTVPEWCELQSQLQMLQQQLEELKAYNPVPVTAEDPTLEIERINAQLVRNAENDAIRERIENLKSEQRALAQRVLDCDKMIHLTENFIKQYLDDVSAAVNGRFENVEFKLFEQQINTGIKPCCEITVNGVPYKSINDSQKILAGLRIIKTLQEIYQKRCPIIIDNGESIDTANRNDVHMPSQMIWLIVNDSEKLEVRNDS